MYFYSLMCYKKEEKNLKKRKRNKTVSCPNTVIAV